MIVFEDVLTEPSRAEAALVYCFPGHPSLMRLAKITMRAVIEEDQPYAQARAVFSRALTGDTVRTLRDSLGPQNRSATFRSARSVLIIDQWLTPFYGNVTPAVSEARQLGATELITSRWLSSFLVDDPRSRVVTTCAILAWCSAMIGGVQDPVVGRPSKIAARTWRLLSTEYLPTAEAASGSVLQAEVVFSGVGMLSAYAEPIEGPG